MSVTVDKGHEILLLNGFRWPVFLLISTRGRADRPPLTERSENALDSLERNGECGAGMAFLPSRGPPAGFMEAEGE